MVLLSTLPVGNNIIDDLLLIIVIIFRKKNILGSIGNAAPECNVSGISSHNLYNTASFMGGRSIPHLVNGFHSRIYRRVKANGILCTGNIQINGSRYAYGVNAKVRQCLCPLERTVSANDHNSVNPMVPADLGTSLLSLFCHKLFAAGRKENRTSPFNGVGYIIGCHIYYFFI